MRLNLRGFIRFLPFFFWQSLQGGFDVARRVMDPRLPISPSFLHYVIRLPDESARLFLAGAISLLPGTLSAELTGADLQVHILDDQQPALQKLRVVENRVAALFGSILTQGDESAPGETSS
jgi:multicomponent Na+:H+ antiporter subunit E